MWREQIPKATETRLRASLGIAEHLTITFAWEHETLSVDDCFPEDEQRQWVREQMESGNEAAHFLAKVTVSDGDAEGTAYLGSCSYNSFVEFMSFEGYHFDDMVRSAFVEYQSEVERLTTKYCGGAA